MNTAPLMYQTWILKAWQDDVSNDSGWRFTIQDTITSERRRFDTMESLLSFIETLQEQRK